MAWNKENKHETKIYKMVKLSEEYGSSILYNLVCTQCDVSPILE